MNVHLFATDLSAIDLVKALPASDRVTCMITPSNRAGAQKIQQLVETTDIPVRQHERGQSLGSGMPPAESGICWLYSQIIPPDDLARYPARILNMHGGKIPEYRGANVLQWAIINGESELGITWHEIVEEVDAGPIWAESTIPIPPKATAADIRQAMIAEGRRLFPEAWRRFTERKEAPRIPNLANGRVWPSRRPEDGRISRGQPTHVVRDMVRALCPPWPAATVWHQGNWREILEIRESPASGTEPYTTSEGTVLYLRLGGVQ